MVVVFAIAAAAAVDGQARQTPAPLRDHLRLPSRPGATRSSATTARSICHSFATIFIFILFANLLGIIPTFESPTMFPPVPLGCALAAFLYYNFWGFGEQGRSSTWSISPARSGGWRR